MAWEFNGLWPVVVKIDLFLLPLILSAAFMAHLDKNSLAYAAVLGMTDDLELRNQQYSWLSSIFYLGYLLMEFPTTWLLTRLPMGKYLGSLLILWGACHATLAGCTDFGNAAIVRFILGVLEAGLIPTCILFTACWYRREEQPLRHALWFTPLSGIFGGVFAYFINDIRSSVPPWKLLFLIYGGCTILLGITCLVALPDHHDTAWFLNPAEREEAKLRAVENKTGTDMQKGWKMSHIQEALRDPKYWIILSFGICQSITNAGITNFNPLILSGFGYSKGMTVLLVAPQGVVALVVQMSASLIATRVPNIRCLLWTLCCFPAILGVLLVRFVDPNQHRITALIGLYLTGFYNAPWVLAMSLISSNNAGATKKSFASVSIAISYAVGNMIGPQFFLESQKPYYSLGIGAMIMAFALMAVCGVLYWKTCLYQNKLRDEAHHESNPLMSAEASNVSLQIEVGEHSDKTDLDIPSFRYIY